MHGFLHVDGIEYIIRRMKDMAADSSCFILDMHHVAGISESAARLLNQSRLGFGADDVAVVFSRIHDNPVIVDPLRRSVQNGDRGFLSFEDNDLAVEWCENHLIGDAVKAPVAVKNLSDSPLFKGMPGPMMSQIEAS